MLSRTVKSSLTPQQVVVRHLHQLVQLPPPNANVPAMADSSDDVSILICSPW